MGMNIVEKLRSLADEIAGHGNALKVQEAWAMVERLHVRAPVDQSAVAAACASRDAAALQRALADKPVDDMRVDLKTSEAGDGAAEFSHDDLAAAMRAFKKRLKLARLNEESRLGSRQLTGGKRSEIDAIVAPTEFPEALWKRLANEGRLVDTGGGFYALPGVGR